jgi:hypothetical protein
MLAVYTTLRMLLRFGWYFPGTYSTSAIFLDCIDEIVGAAITLKPLF